MAVYYVDFVNGLDANNGLGPDASHATNRPWKTLGKLLGASGFASGDTAYLAPGVFREVVTVGMTSAVAETWILADPGNAQGFKTSAGILVEPGDVIWSAWTTSDTAAGSGNNCVLLNGRDYLTFEGIIFSPYTGRGIEALTVASTNITVRDCQFQGNANPGISIGGQADTALNWLIERCTFQGNANGVLVSLPTSASADYDAAVTIRNCRAILMNGQLVEVTASGAGAFKGGGVDLLHSCAFATRLMNIASANVSTSIPCTVHYCWSHTSSEGVRAVSSGQITEDYNVFVASTPRTNVTAGANSVSGNPPARNPFLLHTGQEVLQGRNPRPLWTPLATSPFLGFIPTSASPPPYGTDFLGRPRPAGGASTAQAVGPLERHDTAARETTTVDAGGVGLVIAGPGDQDIRVPVDASATVISVRARYDTNHGTPNKPQALLLANGETGVSAQTLTMSAAADAWETLTFASFTPTAAGVVTVRLVSRAVAGNGKAFFDTMAVA